MTAGIRAIETIYAGHRFRSRLEARWAVFFDALKIPWKYEPQGYMVDGQPYLPDFWISYATSSGIWVEVKGSLDRAGLAKLAAAAGPEGLPLRCANNSAMPNDVLEPGRTWLDCAIPDMPRLILLGDIPPSGEPWVHPLFALSNGRHIIQYPCTWWQREQGWTPMVVGLARRVGADPESMFPHGGTNWALRSHPSLEVAYENARMARFEHGESGAR